MVSDYSVAAGAFLKVMVGKSDNFSIKLKKTMPGSWNAYGRRRRGKSAPTTVTLCLPI